jgi:hypothetical protein
MCPIVVSKSALMPPNYDRITIKKSQRVHDAKLIYQEKQWNGKEYVEQFNVYEVRISAGANPKVVFVLTDPKTILHRGNQFIKIAPINSKPNISFSDVSVISKMAVKLGIESKKPITSWDYLFQIHLSQINNNPLFFKLQPLLDDIEIQEIKRWDFSQLEKDYFNEGLQKDETMIYIFRPQVISFGVEPWYEEDTCKKVQPYNSHSLIITPTKYGKSTLGGKIGELYTDATASRLVGFATADTVAEGDLNGEHKPITMDNVHLYPLNVLSRILELQQIGVTRTGKGKATVETRSTSSLLYIANPPETEDALILCQSFNRVINLLTISATGAVGSRFAQIYFTTDNKAAMGNPLKPDTIKKNKLVFEHILSVVNQEATYKIFPNEQVQEWLNQPIQGFYQTVAQFISETKPFLPEQVAEFWRAYSRDAFRFIRGTALKHAIMDNLKDVYLKNYNIEALIDDAEIHVNRVKSIAIESLQKLLKIIGTKPYEEWIFEKYQSITTDKAKAVVLAVVAYVKQNPNIAQPNIIIPLNHLETVYNSLDEKKKPEGYKHSSDITRNIPKNIDNFNNQLGDLGFRLVRLGNPSIVNLVFTKDGRELIMLSKKLLP